MNKDIYEHLNDVNVDVDEYSEATVTELDKQKVLMNVKKKMRHEKPARWKKNVMAAAMTIGFSSAALFGLSFTAFAHEIPILGNIFQFFGEGNLYSNYGENADQLDVEKEDNGISITLNEAVFDGKTVYLNVTIDSEVDLGESPRLDGIPELMDSHSWVYGSSSDFVKVDDNKYVGMIQGDLLVSGDSNFDSVEQGSFEFNIEGVIPDESLNAETIKGNWNFNFDLSIVESGEQLVDLASEGNGIAVKMKKVVYTPMSFLLYYDEVVSEDLYKEWDFISIDLDVKDDLGNVYTTSYNGGFSNTDRMLHHTNTFEKLDPKATKLFVTPTVELSDADTFYDYGGKSRSINSTAPIEEFELEEIVIEIEK